MLKKKDTLWVLCSFILCLILSSLFVGYIELTRLQEKRDKTSYVTSSQVSRLQYILDTLLLKTQTLEMLVVENGGAVSNFDLIAEKLCDNPAIRSLQLAPDGVVRYLYPLAGNEDGFVDLFRDPQRATEAVEARDSGQLTLSGPFELYQGGFGVVGRRPIYLSSPEGGKVFWGFSIIVLDLPDAFAPARLDMFVKEGYDYKLYRIHPDTGDAQIIGESSSENLTDPVEISFEVPNGVWTFSVMPQGGWIRWRDVALEAVLALLVTLMIPCIVSVILKLGRQQESLYRLSVTDSLTGLQNYSRLMAVLEDFVRSEKPCALYFMDLNGFKSINDTFGHNAGNQVLIESAKRLKSCFQGEGDVFRNGGDEFCAVTSGSPGEDALAKKASDIIDAIESPLALGDRSTVRWGISVGYARFPSDADSMEALIQLADERMYQMKRMRSLEKA